MCCVTELNGLISYKMLENINQLNADLADKRNIKFVYTVTTGKNV